MTVPQTKQPNIKILVLVCGIYLIPVIAAVLYAWFSEGYPLDVSLTVSLYVARYLWTTVLFFVHILTVCILLLLYLKPVKILWIQRILYYLVLLCILGCAIFPCNRSRSVLATQIHDFFSYTLIIAVALTFVGMLVFTHRTGKRVFAVASVIFSAVFIIFFAFEIPAAKDTIFVWENLVLLLFLTELFFEKYNEDDCRRL